MNLQIIKSPQGKAEYVLLPMRVYHELHDEIQKKLKLQSQLKARENEYVLFNPDDYVSNPVALARIKANFTQAELAKRLEVSQAYISKIEKQEKVTPKLLKKIHEALRKK